MWLSLNLIMYNVTYERRGNKHLSFEQKKVSINRKKIKTVP